jgi:hypothetical protein
MSDAALQRNDVLLDLRERELDVQEREVALKARCQHLAEFEAQVKQREAGPRHYTTSRRSTH